MFKKSIGLLFLVAFTMVGCNNQQIITYLLEGNYTFATQAQIEVLTEGGQVIHSNEEFENALVSFYGPQTIGHFILKSPSKIDLIARVNAEGIVVLSMEDSQLDVRNIGTYIPRVTYSTTRFENFADLTTSAQVNIKLDPSLVNTELDDLTVQARLPRLISKMFLYYQQLYVYTDSDEIGLEPESVDTQCEIVVNEQTEEATGIQCTSYPRYQFGGEVVDCHYGNLSYGC